MDHVLDGRADYIYMEHTKESDGNHRFDMRVWKNIGKGGTRLEGESPCACLPLDILPSKWGCEVDAFTGVSRG